MAVLPPDPVYILRHNNVDSVNSLCFHNCNRLFAGSLRGAVNLWDMDTNRLILQLNTQQNNPVLSMLHTNDYLVTQSKGNCIKIWKLTNSGYEPYNEFESIAADNQHLGFCRMAHCPNMNSVLLPKCDNSIMLYDLNNFKESCLLFNYDERQKKLGSIMAVKYLNFNTGQNYVLALYESGDFATWDLRSLKPIHIINFNQCTDGAEDDCPIALDYSVETNRGIYGGTTGNLGVISYNRPTMELMLKNQIQIKNPGINCINIRKDCKIFSTGGSDGRVRIFSWKSLRPLAVLTDHKDSILDIAYSNEKVSFWKSPIMAAGGKDGQITLWDIYN